jgi:ribose 5-phosphate isomerase RpiB
MDPLDPSRPKNLHRVETHEADPVRDPIDASFDLPQQGSRIDPPRTTAGKGKVRLALEIAANVAKPDDTIAAMGAAGISELIVTSGKERTAGLGITVPAMKPRPRLGVPLEVYATTPLEPREKLKSMRIAVSADHGAYGRAEQTAQILRDLGVGEVLVIAPKDPERLNYAISSSAALSLLSSGRVDRVISFCGNGLGALDVANIFAELNHGANAIKPPVYGDNFWTVVDSQRGDSPANVLCLGARLLNVEGDPLAAYLKAFLDDPAQVDALGKSGAPVHGVSSSLVDPKPERIANRTLKDGAPFSGETIYEQAKLGPLDIAKIRSMDVSIYYDASSSVVKQQAKALQKVLPKSVKLEPWDGKALPNVGPDAKVLLLTENGSALTEPRTWGFFRPERIDETPIQRAEHWWQATRFARESKPGPLFLDFACRAFTDAATGGRSYDVLRLLTKAFLLTDRGDTAAQKQLYGEAIDFAISTASGEKRADLASWNEQLEAIVRGTGAGGPVPIRRSAVASMTSKGVA